MSPVLYSFRRCPYAMRARLAVQAAGETVELREIELKAKPAQILAASPKATVPVLVLQDAILEQSLEIMLWALRRSDPLLWLPAGPAAMDASLELIAENDCGFKHHLDRYKYPHRYQLESGLAHRDAGAQFLRGLNQRLTNHPYLSGNTWGLTDAAIAPFVRQFAHIDPTWFDAQDWKPLSQWLMGFEASAAFHAIMQKVAPWKADDMPLLTAFAA